MGHRKQIGAPNHARKKLLASVNARQQPAANHKPSHCGWNRYWYWHWHCYSGAKNFRATQRIRFGSSGDSKPSGTSGRERATATFTRSARFLCRKRSTHTLSRKANDWRLVRSEFDERIGFPGQSHDSKNQCAEGQVSRTAICQLDSLFATWSSTKPSPQPAISRRFDASFATIAKGPDARRASQSRCSYTSNAAKQARKVAVGKRYARNST